MIRLERNRFFWPTCKHLVTLLRKQPLLQADQWSWSLKVTIVWMFYTANLRFKCRMLRCILYSTFQFFISQCFWCFQSFLGKLKNRWVKWKNPFCSSRLVRLDWSCIPAACIGWVSFFPSNFATQWTSCPSKEDRLDLTSHKKKLFGFPLYLFMFVFLYLFQTIMQGLNGLRKNL